MLRAPIRVEPRGRNDSCTHRQPQDQLPASAPVRSLKYNNTVIILVPDFEAKVRRVGSSLGILIPHEVIQNLKVRPNQRIRVVLPPPTDWSDLWGKFESTKTTDELIRSARTERD